MRKRIKISIYTLLFAAILSAFAALILIIPHSTSSVYAATNISAEYKTQGVMLNQNGEFLAAGPPEGNFTVTMSAANVSNSTGGLNTGAVIDWNYVTIKANQTGNVGNYLGFVLKREGVEIESKSLTGAGSQILFQGALDDGNYEFIFRCTINKTNYSYQLAIYKFGFTVDTTAPTYRLKGGEGDLKNGDNTAKSLSYIADDPHFQRLYYKSPSASSYSSTTNTSFSVEPTHANSGWWYFYAIDSLGQKNETVKVYLDCKPPELLLANGMSFGTTVGDAITVTATDEISTAKLLVKYEGEEWFSTGSSYTIPNTERSGRYYFCAEDGNGNRSETSWIVLSTEEPTGNLVKSDTDNSMSFVWNNEYWSATLDGEKYIEGRMISNEGQHEIVLSNNAYKTKRYTFKIEHYYKVVSQTAATCKENGVATYECSQCGDRYEETQYTSGHKYNITSTPSSCTESEKIVYACSLCGERYETEGNYPTGHNYNSTITKEPTCTTDGERLVKCENCETSYIEVITANGHNYEISDTSTKNGTTTRTYKCLDCGDSYKQELGDQYEEVSNYIEYLFEQYSPYMWWVLLASAGIWSIAIGVMIAIAQKNEDKEKAKKMLLNYVIGLVVIAVIVVACPLLIRGIAALIT